MSFLYNAWYCAGWSADLDSAPKAIRMLDMDIVLYRGADGAPVALSGICPHRFAPLSLGRIEGDNLICGYHGLRFDSTGSCVYNPHGRGVVPPNTKLRKYPVADRNGAIWVWTGDLDQAEPKNIPDFDFVVDQENWAAFTGHLHVKANYQLVIDNLLDLTHAAYLHPTTVGVGDESVIGGKRESKFGIVDGAIVSDYRIADVPPTPVFAMWTDRKRGDIRSPISLHLPSNLILDLAMADCGEVPETGSRMPSAHFLVPETETTTHYFYALSRNDRLNDDMLSERMAEIVRHAFVDEDEPMIRAVEHAMKGKDFFSMRPVILETDASGILARRMLAKMIQKEQGEAIEAPVEA